MPHKDKSKDTTNRYIYDKAEPQNNEIHNYYNDTATNFS